MRAISKAFPGVHALSAVDLDVRHGEVHAVIGENGAGKSTLMKILAGALQPDSGDILIDGEKVTIASPLVALELGIAMVYQELSLLPNLSIAENIFLGRFIQSRLGIVDRKAMRQATTELLASLDLSLDPDRPVKDLSVGQRQLVEIAKACHRRPRIIVFDEPTSSLTSHEVDTLFRTIRRLRSQSIQVIYISHRVEEIPQIADRITALRDGRRVGTRDVAGVTEAELVKMMVGREMGQLFPKRDVELGAPVLEVRRLGREGTFTSVDLSVRAGEIVGMAGLVGAGRTEIARAIFGLDRADTGTVAVDGREISIRSSRDAYRAGIGYVPEDRQRDGLFQGLSLRRNLTLAALSRLARLGFLVRGAETALATRITAQLQIRPPNIERQVVTFSGGNQQKAVIGRCLSMEPRVLILDEPTRGIDVGAKAEIHQLIGEAAATGVGILLVSSELPEVLAASDRILVIADGEVVEELDRAEATEDRVMLAATRQANGRGARGTSPLNGSEGGPAQTAD